MADQDRGDGLPHTFRPCSGKTCCLANGSLVLLSSCYLNTLITLGVLSLLGLYSSWVLVRVRKSDKGSQELLNVISSINLHWMRLIGALVELIPSPRALSLLG